MYRYFIYVLLLLIYLFPCSVKADCNDIELEQLKEVAREIKIDYRYDPDAVSARTEEDYDDEIENYEEELPVNIKGAMDIIITGLNEKLYIQDQEYGRIFNFDDMTNNAIIIDNESGGEKKYDVYSFDCSTLLRTIKIKVPKYNIYSEDPLCEGISGSQLSVCGEFYDYDLDYDTFKMRVEQYRKGIKDDKPEDEVSEDKNVVVKVSNFFENNYLYIIGGILVIILIVVLLKIHRKRSVLE